MSYISTDINDNFESEQAIEEDYSDSFLARKISDTYKLFKEKLDEVML